MSEGDIKEINQLIKRAKYTIYKEIEEELAAIIYKAYVTGKESTKGLNL